MTSPRRSDAGAILLPAAVALFGLVACTAFVIDYGMQLVARAEAQTAADAGALAGAGSLAIASACTTADVATARQVAVNVARQNAVWGEPPATSLADVTTPLCPDGRASCIQAAVYRDATHGNPLPTIVGQMLGIDSLGVAAHAVAEWTPAATTDCLRPFAVADRWSDSAGAWSVDRTYDRLAPSGPPSPDSYVAPTAGGSGTGLTVGAFCGALVRLTPATTTSRIRPWHFVPLDLLRADRFLHGGDNLYKNVATCNALPTAVGDRRGLVAGPVEDSIDEGVDELIARDPSASWDPVRRRIAGGCMTAGTCVVSPRLIAVALFDPDEYEIDRLQAGRVSEVTIRNIVGFFIANQKGDDIEGYVTLYPGLGTALPALGADAGFLRAAFLVR